MRTLILIFVLGSFSVAIVHAQSTSSTPPPHSTAKKPLTKPAAPTKPKPNISQSFADEAIVVLKAINADTGNDADGSIHKAMSDLEVDETDEQVATISIDGALFTIQLQAEINRLKNQAATDGSYLSPIPVQCLQDFTKELRSLYWTDAPASCGTK
jgi:hypothetical protein